MKKKYDVQSTFLNVRVLIRVSVVLAGIFLTLLGLAAFSNARAQVQKQRTTQQLQVPVSYEGIEAASVSTPTFASTADIVGGNNGRLYNDPAWITGKVGRALSFNGQNQYVVVRNTIGDDFSIDFWVKTTANSLTGGQCYEGNGLVWADVPDTPGNDWNLSVLNNKACFMTGNPDTSILSNTNINDGQWHFVAVTRAKATGVKKLYLDGVLQATGTTNTNTLLQNPRVAIAGNLLSNSNNFNGAMDEVEFFNRVLTDAEIQSIYNAGSAGKCKPTPPNPPGCVPPPSGLVNWWPFEEGPTPMTRTNPATNVASFSATLNGSVNPRGSTTTIYFRYGPTTSYGTNTPMQTRNGNTARDITANIGGLVAGRTYHFRIVAHNAGGTSIGGDRTFTALNTTGPPVVITNPATSIASSSATLNGSVDPHGLTTIVSFQYGTTTSYSGLISVPQSQTGNTYRNISADISRLSENTKYHFRILATNTAGTRYGDDRTFTTSFIGGCFRPDVDTSDATDVADTCATLHGTVNPNSLTTTVHFEYDNGGQHHSTPDQTFHGNTVQPVRQAILELTPDTFSSFTLVATNSCGTTTTTSRSFCPSPWDGTWTGTIPNLVCGTGNTTFTMTISNNGGNVSGNASWDNIPCLSGGQCVGVVNDSSGTVSGSISYCSTISIHYTGTASGCGCGCDGQTVEFELTGTRNGRVIRFNDNGYQFHFTKTSPPPDC